MKNGAAFERCSKCQEIVANCRCTTQPTPEAAQREQMAKALYEHERAEEAKDGHVGADYYAPWPSDSQRQPYCQWAYRAADAVIAALAVSPLEAQGKLRELAKALREEAVPHNKANTPVNEGFASGLVHAADRIEVALSTAPEDQAKPESTPPTEPPAFKVGDEVLVRGRVHSLHTSSAKKPAAEIDLYDVPYRLSFHLEDVRVAAPSAGEQDDGREQHRCSCGDIFPTVADFIRHREMVHDELQAGEQAAGQREERLTLNLDLKTAGEIGVFDWLRSKGFEVSAGRVGKREWVRVRELRGE